MAAKRRLIPPSSSRCGGRGSHAVALDPASERTKLGRATYGHPYTTQAAAAAAAPIIRPMSILTRQKASWFSTFRRIRVYNVTFTASASMEKTPWGKGSRSLPSRAFQPAKCNCQRPAMDHHLAAAAVPHCIITALQSFGLWSGQSDLQRSRSREERHQDMVTALPTSGFLCGLGNWRRPTQQSKCVILGH